MNGSGASKSPGSFARAAFRLGSTQWRPVKTSGAGHHRETLFNLCHRIAGLTAMFKDNAYLHDQGDILDLTLEDLQRAAHHTDPTDRVTCCFRRNTITVSGEKKLD